ncbi:MAG: hypothetical protein IKT99_03845 [Oscillospiraceae bacterium]|nr:hypothetical protein [Oscillospiraceae bacterium]
MEKYARAAPSPFPAEVNKGKDSAKCPEIPILFYEFAIKIFQNPVFRQFGIEFAPILS